MAGSGLCQLFVLLDLADEVHGATDDALRPFGLSRATFQVLFTLGRRGPQSHKTLAEHANCGASNVTRVVDRLEREGFVAREGSPEDRRLVLATVTPAGQAALDGAIEALSGLQDRLLGRLNDARAVCGTHDDNVGLPDSSPPE